MQCCQNTRLSATPHLIALQDSASSESTHHEKHRFVHSRRGSIVGAIVSCTPTHHACIHHVHTHTDTPRIPLHASMCVCVRAHACLSLLLLQANRRRSTIDHSHIAHLHAETIPEENILDPAPSTSAGTVASTTPDEEEEEEENKIYLIPCFPPVLAAPPDPALVRQKCGVFQFVLKWHLFVQSFPYLVLFTWTIPNCSRNRKWYIVASSFTMSVLWIALLSFVLVTVVAKIGCILGIDELVMGLVVVAMGTSIPVSKRGGSGLVSLTVPAHVQAFCWQMHILFP